MLRYDPSTALVVVDVQNDFADPAGSLTVRGGEDIIRTINGEIVMATNAGAFIVFTKDWHPESTPHFAKDGGIWPVHCVADTWGSEIHPGLAIPEGAPIVHKGISGEDGYSGFNTRHPVTGEERSTDLEAILRDRDIRRLVVVGLATDYCIKATALDSIGLGFETFLLTDAVAAVDLEPGDGARVLEELREAGVGMWRTVMR